MIITILMPFIVIEGLDGSGKSTQIGMIRKYLENAGIIYHYLHFPRTDIHPFGDLIAGFLRGDFGEIDQVHPKLVASIYALDRMDAKIQMDQWLLKKELILCDRYVFSNIAFQCAKLKNASEKKALAAWIKEIEFNYFKIPKPDLSVFLNVPFSFIARNLTNQRQGEDRGYLAGKTDIHEEDLEFQRKVHETYLWQVGVEDDFIPVDCSASEDKILQAEEIFNRLLSLFQKNEII
jgi:dTMP kinase